MKSEIVQISNKKLFGFKLLCVFLFLLVHQSCSLFLTRTDKINPRLNKVKVQNSNNLKYAETQIDSTYSIPDCYKDYLKVHPNNNSKYVDRISAEMNLINTKCSRIHDNIDTIKKDISEDSLSMANVSDMAYTLINTLFDIDSIASNIDTLVDNIQFSIKDKKWIRKKYARLINDTLSKVERISQDHNNQLNDIRNDWRKINYKLTHIFKNGNVIYSKIQILKGNLQCDLLGLKYEKFNFYGNGNFLISNASFHEDEFIEHINGINKIVQKYKSDTSFSKLNIELVIISIGYADEQKIDINSEIYNKLQAYSNFEMPKSDDEDSISNFLNKILSEYRSKEVIIKAEELSNLYKNNLYTIFSSCYEGKGLEYPNTYMKPYYLTRINEHNSEDSERKIAKIFFHIIAW
jgi:hypothetical protein